MAIKRIRVTNFKSFKELEVQLGNFNVLIGANASGKSNFIKIFEFLREIMKSRLNNAISMQGGIEYLRNINLGASENLEVSVVSAPDFKWFGKEMKNRIIGIKPHEVTYEFAIKFKTKGQGFEIIKDRLNQKCEFIDLRKHKEKVEEKENLGKGEITISCSNGKVKIDLDIPEKVPLKEDDIVPPFLREFFRERRPSNTLLLERPFLFMPTDEIFGGISIYDFDPKLPKKATPITGKADLEEDGSNLSIVLKNIIENKDGRRKLFNLISELLPFVDDLDVEKFADKNLLFKLREKYFKKQFLPASLISDGTLNIIALIIALYFGRKPLTIIEEPERNIHPHLIAKVVKMMKDASHKKQIIVTTHNPEIVKFADPENILLMSRDNKGFSIISRPVDKKEVQTFLENEIGIEELFVQSLLEV